MKKLICILFLLPFLSIGQIVPFGFMEEGVSYGPELVTNGGFDSDVSSWTTGGLTLTWNSGVLDMTSGITTGNFRQQNITVEASTDYLFSFDAKKGTVTAMKYGVYDVSNSSDIISATPFTVSGSVFERVNVEFTTPSGCTTINVYPERSSTVGTAFYDNVSLKKVL